MRDAGLSGFPGSLRPREKAVWSLPRAPEGPHIPAREGVQEVGQWSGLQGQKGQREASIGRALAVFVFSHSSLELLRAPCQPHPVGCSVC